MKLIFTNSKKEQEKVEQLIQKKESLFQDPLKIDLQYSQGNIKTPLNILKNEEASNQVIRQYTIGISKLIDVLNQQKSYREIYLIQKEIEKENQELIQMQNLMEFRNAYFDLIFLNRIKEHLEEHIIKFNRLKTIVGKSYFDKKLGYYTVPALELGINTLKTELSETDSRINHQKMVLYNLLADRESSTLELDGLEDIEKLLPKSVDFKNKDELVNYYARIFLKSSDFANYWSLYFGDLLREKTKIRNSSYASYYKYIADSLDQNKPYDQFVRELLTSLGSPDKNPAVNFYLRDNADPLEVAEYVSRAFYGKRLSCARCHDHPFENFTQRDYYGLAAFFGQVYIRNYSYDFIPWERIQDLPAHLQDEYKKKIHEWNKIPNKDQNKLPYATVSIEKELGLRFPVLDNKPGGDIVKPRLPDGTIVSVKNEDLREIFADWLVRQERFRKVIINRIWTKLMGWSFFIH